MSVKDAEDTKIQDFVVLPEVISSSEQIEPHVAIKQITDFIRQKTHESEKCVEATSAVSFMANSLQTRQLPTEFSIQVAKFFNDLEVTSDAECNQKLEQISEGNEEAADMLEDLKNAWSEWESFLEKVDKSVEQLAGPCNPKSITSTDNIKFANSKGKTLQSQGTLLSYVQNSPFPLMFIEVVFSINECASHVLQIYEKHSEFQALSCDILLLTKSGDGGGFLKLVGVPFRLLLDEEQSLARILQHRQSAVSLSGQRAITLLAEISSKGAETEFLKDGFSRHGGAILLNQEGTILFNHSCKDNSDWPNVNDILEEVKKNKKDGSDEKPSSAKSSKDTHVEVGKKKCCIIM